jgi:7,8-dihydroneopterin aldolase/epimerase/oxygenase
MITIAIQGAEFFAYHGFYPEEQLLGARFMVDASVDFEPVKDIKQDNISNTVDYEQLYHIVCEQMKQTRKLIETVAQSIADQIRERYPFAKKVQVSIKKMNPPLAGKVDHSKVVITV